MNDIAALIQDLTHIEEGMIGPPYHHDEDAKIVRRAIEALTAPPPEERIRELEAELGSLKAKRDIQCEVENAAMLRIHELENALNKSIELQSHYATLLNEYDGGKRIPIANAMAWIERLRAIATAADPA